MPADIPPIPAEQEALDKPWRLWASIAVGSFVLLSVALGFLLLPESEERGFDPLASICRALGIPGYNGPVPSTEASKVAAPPSRVAWTSDTRSLMERASTQRGATIAAEVCAGCHGEAGEAADPSFPNLSQLSTAAIFKQLQDYRNDSRAAGQAEVMVPFAQALDDEAGADVSAFYASREDISRDPAKDAVVPEIEGLARRGDPDRSLPACDSCHGANHSGPPDAPVLLGQSAPYLELQLQLFASGERKNDIYARMREISRKLTAAEIHGLAVYYRGVPAPR
jgi:cytochrome c553